MAEMLHRARSSAQINHKFLMVEFGADCCSDCLGLSKELEKGAVRNYLKEHFVVLNVGVAQSNRNIEVAKSLGVDINRGIPTAVFFPPGRAVPSKKLAFRQTPTGLMTSQPGFDRNGDTNTNDRPAGNKRNAGIGPRYFKVNLSFQKRVNLKSEAGRKSAKSPSGPNMTLILNSWNAFNHPQHQNYSGVMTSTFFGHPNRASSPRDVEVGMRLTF